MKPLDFPAVSRDLETIFGSLPATGAESAGTSRARPVALKPPRTSASVFARVIGSTLVVALCALLFVALGETSTGSRPKTVSASAPPARAAGGVRPRIAEPTPAASAEPPSLNVVERLAPAAERMAGLTGESTPRPDPEPKSAARRPKLAEAAVPADFRRVDSRGARSAGRGECVGLYEDELSRCLYPSLLSADRRLLAAYERAADSAAPVDALRYYKRRWNRARKDTLDDPRGTLREYDALTRELLDLGARYGG